MVCTRGKKKTEFEKKLDTHPAALHVQKGYAHINGKCIPVLTTVDMQRLFSVTYMTIYNWRRYKGLPCVIVPCNTGHNVFFDKDDVRQWAEEHDKEYLIKVARELGV